MYGKNEYVSYPFLYEKKSIVDFELATDELASCIGLAISNTPNSDLKQELILIMEEVYHVNPMVRKQQAMDVVWIEWLQTRYLEYLEATKNRSSLFVLPCGSIGASTLHVCRTKAKKIVRLMYHLTEQGIVVDPTLFDMMNVLANYLFTAAMYANQLEGVQELPFKSRVYNS